MRSDVALYDLVAPATLDAVLQQLASEPGKHTLIAGGTEVMVALNTGRLNQHSLLSIQHLRALRFIDVQDNAIHIGSGTTFTDLRRSELVGSDLPLMAQSASWTGRHAASFAGLWCDADAGECQRQADDSLRRVSPGLQEDCFAAG